MSTELPNNVVTADAPPAEAGPVDAPALRLRHLKKRFQRRRGGEAVAIDDTTLEVAQGEFVVLLGPSGCGKTTLLRCIAGLERPDEGEIEIGGKTVFSAGDGIFVGPEHRGISMVFQSYALWPHMSAFQNVAYPLRYGKASRLKSAEITERVQRSLELVGIGDLGAQFPHQMSGGQQQRVALARALVGGSRVILFDEPLSNVDAKVREQLRTEIVDMQREIGFTAVYVTHDQAEAMQLADRIAVIESGRIEQVGSSQEIYLRPRTRRIAKFVGTTNEAVGVVREVRDGSVTIECEGLEVVSTAESAASFRPGDKVVATWRPERCTVAGSRAAEAANCWPATVRTSLFVGAYSETFVQLGTLAARHASSSAELLPKDAQVWLSVDPMDVRVFAADDESGAAP